MRALRTRWRGAAIGCAAAVAGAVLAPEARAQAFGATVVVRGDAMFAGAPGNEDAPGAVHVFERRGDGWAEVARLQAPDAGPGDGFGMTLDVDGTTLVTSSMLAGGQGRAWLFKRSRSGGWEHAQTLAASDGAEGDAFGVTTALDDDDLLIGAYARGDTAGAVYAFRRDGSGRWSQTAILQGEDTAAKDRFGVGLALEGGRALIQASRHDEEKGAAYVFERGADGGWSQVAKLQSRGAEKGNRLGSVLLLRGDRAFVGSDRSSGFAGAVFSFVRDPASGDWREDARLQAFDAAPGARFGTAASFDGRELWVGAAGAEQFAGRAYRFTLAEDDGGWMAAEKLAPESSRSGDFFAGALDLGEGIGVVAAPNADFGLGAAYVFEPAAESWTQTAKLFVEETGMDPLVGAPVDCAGGRAASFDCGAVDLVAFLPNREIGAGRGIRLNDIWGWTDPETGREYALVGRMDGTAFVDVTSPANPVYVGQLPLTEGAVPNTWRDIKVYREHAFVVADGAGAHGMQVFDLRQLRGVTPGAMPVTFDETARYDRIASAHNIVINEETGFAYAVGASMGGETCGGALHMIDIREPTSPSFAGCFADAETGRQKTGYTHDAQCVLYRGPDADWQGREICFNASETALGIADVTDKASPKSIAVASYPNVAYTHQGWLTVDHRYFYINDELDEVNGSVEGTRTLVWDVTDLDDPLLAREHIGTQRSVDHNLYVKGDRMYQSNYNSGLRVLDISDPENPVEVGWFDTHPQGGNDPSMSGSWSNYPYFESGTIVVTDIENGLFILREREGRPVS
jgi:choice-of-anchor B domain-containing protein